VNECLPHGLAGRQRIADGFEQSFVEAPDLSGLSFAARRVLVAAATLFHEQGATATSVRDIARACALTPGALYNHFASKDDVLYTIVRHGHDSLEARLTETIDAAEPEPIARTQAFVHAYVTGHLVHPELAQVVRREYVHLSPDRFAEITGRRRAMRTRLVVLLRAGARAGDFALLGGRDAATRTATMVLDMCSRTSEWYDPSRTRSEQPARLADRYVEAAMRLAGARMD
jgi:TetR/AcrR family transcriptional regulator, cholesterol catabolism regulator